MSKFLLDGDKAWGILVDGKPVVDQEIKKHLAGQHNQQTHAGGMGGGGQVSSDNHAAAAASPNYPEKELRELREKSHEIYQKLRALDYNPFEDIQYSSPEIRELRLQERELDQQWNDLRSEWYNQHLTVNGKGTGTDPTIVSENPARDTYVVYDKATLAMNKSLRKGNPPSERVIKIDEMVAEGKAVSDTIVYRSAVLPEKMHSVFEEGFEYTDKAFMSTSVTRDGGAGAQFYADARVENGAKGDVVMMSIKIPQGATARDVGIGEVVLPRNTTVRVTSRSKGPNNTVELGMEVVQQ